MGSTNVYAPNYIILLKWKFKNPGLHFDILFTISFHNIPNHSGTCWKFLRIYLELYNGPLIIMISIMSGGLIWNYKAHIKVDANQGFKRNPSDCNSWKDLFRYGNGAGRGRGRLYHNYPAWMICIPPRTAQIVVFLIPQPLPWFFFILSPLPPPSPPLFLSLSPFRPSISSHQKNYKQKDLYISKHGNKKLWNKNTKNDHH